MQNNCLAVANTSHIYFNLIPFLTQNIHLVTRMAQFVLSSTFPLLGNWGKPRYSLLPLKQISIHQVTFVHLFPSYRGLSNYYFQTFSPRNCQKYMIWEVHAILRIKMAYFSHLILPSISSKDYIHYNIYMPCFWYSFSLNAQPETKALGTKYSINSI